MIDDLTGLPNLLGLLDWCGNLTERILSSPPSLLGIQLTALWQVNRNQGRAAGDELLKDFAQFLKAIHSGLIFRAGGDKFVLVLQEKDLANTIALVQSTMEKIQLKQMFPSLPAARLAIIHFSHKTEFTPGNLLACLFVTLSDRYQNGQKGQIIELRAKDILDLDEYPWMMLDLADQIKRIGDKTCEAMRLAEIDCISKLPNLNAAMSHLDSSIANCLQSGSMLSVLLVDGDNLRQYNQVGYSAGDEAIRLISATLQQQLRETDFLARYRAGDEFLVLLPDTDLDRALYVGQRLCRAVERASKAWLFPTTISIGIALFPVHGQTPLDLLDRAEQGLDRAKKQGKNKVSVFK